MWLLIIWRAKVFDNLSNKNKIIRRNNTIHNKIKIKIKRRFRKNFKG